MRKVTYVAVMLALVFALVPAASAQDGGMMGGPNVVVTLNPSMLADSVGLAGVTGWAHVNSDTSTVHISLTPNGATLPEGSVLEGWVVDAGLAGGPGTTNVSDADETYGTPFGNADFDAAVDQAPYALSTGVITPTMDGTWESKIEFPGYNFSPYDAVVITLESDADSTDGFDPRPGAVIFTGDIAMGTPPDDTMGGDTMGDTSMDQPMGDESMTDQTMTDELMTDQSMTDQTMGDESMTDQTMTDESMTDQSMTDQTMTDELMDQPMGDDDMGAGDMMQNATTVTLTTTEFADGAGLGALTGSADVYVDAGMLTITVTLNGATVPEGSVLEGWVVDAGLDGGPGTTNASDADEMYGIAFDNADFGALVASAPYALSTGLLHDNMDGTLTLSFTVPAYNFSPYDAVVITLESDGDAPSGFDPRPGTPILSGDIAHEMM